ncbi:MAG: hypothetical protein ACR2GR_03570 [Rhodothermales bacterium]
MPLLYALLLAFQTSAPFESAPTGNEWMVVASVVIPAVLVIVLVYLGSRNTV